MASYNTFDVESDDALAVQHALDPGGALVGLHEGQIADKKKKKAQEELDRLSAQAKPTYTANKALMSYYSKVLNSVNNPVGYTAAEKATFKNNQATTINTIQNNAIRTSGGSLSRYLAAALNPAIVNSNNQFAAQDASMRQNSYNQGMGRLYGVVNQLQSLDNMNVGNAYDYRMRKELALGNSILQQGKYAQDQRNETGPRVMNSVASIYTMGAAGGKKKPAGSQYQGTYGDYNGDPGYNPYAPMNA